MSRNLIKWAGFPVGAVLGVVAGFYAQYSAEAAVEVRPKLAEVGFVDAMMTNHSSDWLYYHYPVAMTAVATVVFALVLGIGWLTVE